MQVQSYLTHRKMSKLFYITGHGPFLYEYLFPITESSRIQTIDPQNARKKKGKKNGFTVYLPVVLLGISSAPTNEGCITSAE